MFRCTPTSPQAHPRRVRRALMLTCALLAPASALVAQSAAPAPLALSDVYRDLRTNSPRLAAAAAAVRAAESRVPGAGLPPDPEVQLGWMNYSLPDLAPMDRVGMTQLQVMQMVPLGGKVRLGRDIARTEAATQSHRAARVWWELRAESAQRYYDLYQLDARLVVMRETVRLLDDIRRTAEAMYRVGEGRQADVLRAQVELARMAEDTVRMDAMRTATAAQLAGLLDRDPRAAAGATVLPPFPTAVPSLDSLLALAVTSSPALAVGRGEVTAAGQARALAEKALLPDLRVGIQIGRGAASMTSLDAAGRPMTERRTELMGSLMLGASVPVFAGSRQRRQQEAAEAMRQESAAELAAMQADVRARIGMAYAGLQRARTLAVLYRTTILPQAQAAVASAQSAYRVGRVDFMTLLDNQMAVNRYRQELAVLEAEEGKAWAELEAATGTELLAPPATGGEGGDAR